METKEYRYDDNELAHMDESDVLDSYRNVREKHRDSLIILEDLDCGHWHVTVHSSDDEKDTVLRDHMRKALRAFSSHFRMSK